MDKRRNIFLIAPMGTGKTTIGRHLARSLRMEFIDSDQVIEERTGADIPWIFDIEGEAGFRRREEAVIDDLTRRDNVVVATGGGAILSDKSRERFKQRGIVVYLHTDVAQLMKRMAKDRKRPLLQTEDPRQRLEELMAVREPLYREIADITLVTSDFTIRDAVKQLTAEVTKKRRRRHSGYNKAKSHAN